MSIKIRFWKRAGAVSALVVMSQTVGCTTDDTNASGTGGTGSSNGGADTGGGAGPGGTTSTNNGGSTSVAPSACAALSATSPGIADFDSWNGTTSLATWNFALGGDAASAVYAGTFGYGDRAGNLAETFDMVAGSNGTTYALRVADTNAVNFGGGLGIWLNPCINASVFSGISFWVRGIAPTGKATLKVSTPDTTTSTPASGTPGTCPGTDKTCVHPAYEFPVTDTWTEIKVPWSAFKSGDAAGTLVPLTGARITQLGIDIGLNWVAGDAGAYVPVAGAYELVVDGLTFY